MAETYICELCRQEFGKVWTDEEALAESRETFGPIAPDERAVVCDDCYMLILARRCRIGA
jgi:hypothetical protein